MKFLKGQLKTLKTELSDKDATLEDATRLLGAHDRDATVLKQQIEQMTKKVHTTEQTLQQVRTETEQTLHKVRSDEDARVATLEDQIRALEQTTSFRDKYFAQLEKPENFSFESLEHKKSNQSSKWDEEKKKTLAKNADEEETRTRIMEETLKAEEEKNANAAKTVNDTCNISLLGEIDNEFTPTTLAGLQQHQTNISMELGTYLKKLMNI